MNRMSAAIMGATGVAMLALSGAGAAGAAASCNIADFTTGTTVNMDGYLACLSGAGLPSTGTDMTQVIGLGAGLVAVGAAAFVVARQRRTQRA